MDWITGISKAIDYIEKHITEPTDYARAAKIICRRREFTKPGDDYTNREIPEFWNECGRDGSIQKLCGYIKDSAQFKGTSRRVLLDRDDGQRLPLRHRRGV